MLNVSNMSNIKLFCRKTDSSRSLFFIGKPGKALPFLVSKSDPCPCRAQWSPENNMRTILATSAGRRLMCLFPLFCFLRMVWDQQPTEPTTTADAPAQEHVGRNSYSTFFDKCYELLKVATQSSFRNVRFVCRSLEMRMWVCLKK